MSRRCDIDASKGVLVGHQVSHSNRKAKKRFLPNLQMVSFISDILGQTIKLRLTPSTVRTIEHNHGIDSFLLNTSSSKLTEAARKLKTKIRKAQAAKAA